MQGLRGSAGGRRWGITPTFVGNQAKLDLHVIIEFGPVLKIEMFQSQLGSEIMPDERKRILAFSSVDA